MTAIIVGVGVGWLAAVAVGPRRIPDRLLCLSDRPEGPRASTARAVRRTGRRSSESSAVTSADLAATADLLAVAVSAGHSLLEAVRIAGAEGVGPAANAMRRVADDVARGRRLVDALSLLPTFAGPAAASLSSTLSVAAAGGTAVGPALVRLADAERRRARRRAEARARRLPVLLLGPLVGLILPAFVVLTLVPLGIAVSERPASSAPPESAASLRHHPRR
ncbi:MAG: type II secretion system F family protein [Actinomycetes bacterium]